MVDAKKTRDQDICLATHENGQKAHWYQDKKTAKPQRENHYLICEKALA